MNLLFCTAGDSPALRYAISILKGAGIPFADTSDLTASHLLLPVPSLNPQGELVGGDDLRSILPQFSKDICLIGGNLDFAEGYNKMDLLQDDTYVSANAAITAHCAIGHAIARLPVTLERCPVLVIGWGRIGKCLCKLLGGLGASVTIAARKSADRAMAMALGYSAIPTDGIDPLGYRVIFNTAPAMVLPDGGTALKIDLASKPGIGGEDVIWARGIPGKDAPESSGKLIADRILCKLEEGGYL